MGHPGWASVPSRGLQPCTMRLGEPGQTKREETAHHRSAFSPSLWEDDFASLPGSWSLPAQMMGFPKDINSFSCHMELAEEAATAPEGFLPRSERRVRQEFAHRGVAPAGAAESGAEAERPGKAAGETARNVLRFH